MRLVLNCLLVTVLLFAAAVADASPNAGSVTEETGAYAYVAPLIKANGSGLPFYFRMDYTSVLPANRTSHWQHNFAWKVIENPDLSVTVYKGDAVVTRGNFEIMEKFGPPAAGVYTATYMTYSRLNKTATNFVYTTRSLTTYTFDLTGRLLSIVDRNGNTESLTYDANGNLATVVDSRGNTATFSYDASFNLVSVSYSGFQVLFTYDVNRNLTSITDLNGNITRFTYDASGRLLTVMGSNATRLVQNSYDATSRVVSQVDAKGATTTYAYTVDANNFTTVTKTDRLGRISKSMFDVDRYAVTKSSSTGETLYAASFGPQKLVMQDASVPIVLDMDRYGNPLHTTKSGVSSTATYDAQGRLLTTTKATGETAALTYDTRGNLLSRSDYQGNVVTYLYDARGNVISKTDGLGNTTSYIYTGQGDLQSLTDAAGNTTTFTYDQLGRLLTLTLPSRSVTSFTYDRMSHLLSQTDGLGQSLRYVYDVYGQLVSNTDAKGGVTSLVYDANGNVTSVKDRAGNVTTVTYDAENNVTSVTDPLGNRTTRSYDGNDQVLTTTDPLGFIRKNIWGDPGLLIRSIDSAGVGAFNQYSNGLLASVSNSAKGDVSFERDANGRVAAVQDALQRKTQLTYNGNDQLTGSIDATKQAVTSSYDVNGKLLSYTDAAGNTTSYAYDVRGLRISESDAKGNITRVAYNADGLLASRTLASGAVLRYSYDAANRLTSVSSPTETISYTLDANGNRTKIVSSLTGTITQSFDAMDRLINRTDVFGNRTNYTYDANGNMTSMTYPGGKVVSYTYDANNRMVSVTDWAGRVTRYSYVAGTKRIATQTLPEGSVQSYTYDGTGRLASLTDVAGATTIYSEQFTRDAAGQITSINEGAPVALARQAVVDHRTYDVVNQLVTTTAGTFTYDTDGNLTLQLRNGVTTNMSYDAFGRLMSRGAGSYRYDASGMRIESTIAGLTKRYVQDDSGDLTRILMEQDGAGVATAWNVYGPGLLYRVDAAGNPVYYHFNHLGTTMALTNAAGAVTDAYAYDIYGKIQNRTGTTVQPFTYHGQWGVVDDGNNFYYMRARYYDAVLQRFITRDNIYVGGLSRSSSLNRHAFVEGNPVMWSDPKGEFLFLIPVAIELGVEIAPFVIELGVDAYAAYESSQVAVNLVTGEYTSDGTLGVSGGTGWTRFGLDLVPGRYGRRIDAVQTGRDIAAHLARINQYMKHYRERVTAGKKDTTFIVGGVNNWIRANRHKKPEPTVPAPNRCGAGLSFRGVYQEASVPYIDISGTVRRLTGGTVSKNVCIYTGCDQEFRNEQLSVARSIECDNAISKPLLDSGKWRTQTPSESAALAQKSLHSCTEPAIAKIEKFQEVCRASMESRGNYNFLANCLGTQCIFTYMMPAR